MAVRKKGSRRIVVDGVTYLWRFPRRSSDWDGNMGCTATVQLPDRRGSVLLICFPQQHPQVAAGFGVPVLPVLPSHISDAIRCAIAAGWRPTEPGAKFGISGVDYRPIPVA